MSSGEREGTERPASVLCRRCSHYYITWDKRFPHGCKAMGFKSRSSPSSLVRTSSGMECLFFVEKKVERKRKG